MGAGDGDSEKPLSLALAAGSGEQQPGEENGRPEFQGGEGGPCHHEPQAPLPDELKSRC